MGFVVYTIKRRMIVLLGLLTKVTRTLYFGHEVFSVLAEHVVSLTIVLDAVRGKSI